MLKIIGWLLFAVGTWMFVSPQALTGLAQLKWMSKYAFSGEVMLGVLVMMAAYYLLALQPRKGARKASH